MQKKTSAKKKQKRHTEKSPFWSGDYKLFWEDQPDTRGPDPRIRKVEFYVYSSDDASKNEISDPFAKFDFDFSTNDIHEAIAMYHERIQRPETFCCDLQMCVTFGGYWSTLSMVCPRYNESWTYVARWRADTVCLESYSINPMRFAERSTLKTNELPENDHAQNGLLSFWKQHPLNTKK